MTLDNQFRQLLASPVLSHQCQSSVVLPPSPSTIRLEQSLYSVIHQFSLLLNGHQRTDLCCSLVTGPTVKQISARFRSSTATSATPLVVTHAYCHVSNRVCSDWFAHDFGKPNETLSKHSVWGARLDSVWKNASSNATTFLLRRLASTIVWV